MANKKYKLTDGNYWATDGIHDFGQNKTQREINAALVQADSDLSGALDSLTFHGTLDSTKDLDDYWKKTDNGFYYISNAQNAPMAYGALIVIGQGVTTAAAAYQLVYASGQLSYRGKTGGPPTVWREWNTVANASDLTPITSAITSLQTSVGNLETNVSTTTPSEILTAATGFTITSVEYKQYGKIAMIDLRGTITNAVTTASTIQLATLVSGKRPAIRAAATVITSINPAKAQIFTTGSITAFGTCTANSDVRVCATYILA